MERIFDYIKIKKDSDKSTYKRKCLTKKFVKGVRIQKEWLMNFKNYSDYRFFHGGNTIVFSDNVCEGCCVPSDVNIAEV